MGEYEGVNIGDTHDPKMINIGKCYSYEEKEATKWLFIEYQDFFCMELQRLEKLSRWGSKTYNFTQTYCISLLEKIKEL